MSAPVNSEARNPTQKHTDGTKLSVPGWDRTYNALVSTPLSQCIDPPCQPGMVGEKENVSVFAE